MFAYRSGQIPASIWRCVCDTIHCVFIFLSCCVFFLLHTAHLDTYHQYDTVVYPKDVKSPKSWYERTKEKAKSFFGFGSGSKSPDEYKEENLRIFSPFEMGKLCLQVYLEGCKQMLCSGSFPQPANLQTIVEEICHIFNLLFHPLIFHQNSSTPQERKLEGKFTEVCLFTCHFTLLPSAAHKFYFLRTGNERVAGVYSRGVTGWSNGGHNEPTGVSCLCYSLPS